MPATGARPKKTKINLMDCICLMCSGVEIPRFQCLQSRERSVNDHRTRVDAKKNVCVYKHKGIRVDTKPGSAAGELPENSLHLLLFQRRRPYFEVSLGKVLMRKAWTQAVKKTKQNKTKQTNKQKKKNKKQKKLSKREKKKRKLEVRATISETIIRELKHRRFWDANGDRKANVTDFGALWVQLIIWKGLVLAF